MVSVTRHNLFALSVNGGQPVDQHGNPFDVEAYSKFKYGQADIARHYGFQLASDFIAHFPQSSLDEGKIVVSGPSYKYLSTASHGVVHYFCIALNAFRLARGLEPAQQMHSIRSIVGTDTYAMGDAAHREAFHKSCGHQFDTELVRGSLFVFVDDVNVTGATEERTIARTLPCQPRAIFSLHVAAIDPAYASANAKIENAMNKTVLLRLDAIDRLIKEDNFRLNTRVFRSIMEWDNLDELEDFLLRQRDSLLLEMYAALVGGTVEMYGRKPKATNRFEEVLRSRELLPEVS